MTNRNQLTQGQAIALADYVRKNIQALQGLTLKEAAKRVSAGIGTEYTEGNISGMLKTLGLSIKPEDDMQYLAGVVAILWNQMYRREGELDLDLPERLAKMAVRQG